MGIRSRQAPEVRVYVSVGSEDLTLSEVSEALGLQPSAGWSIGDPTRRGEPRDMTAFDLHSGRSARAEPEEHLRALIDPAEQVVDAVVASEGVLGYVTLEVVESFPGAGGTLELFLDERWVRALSRVEALLDVDQYITFEPSDRAWPETPDALMIGQTLWLSLNPMEDMDASTIDVTRDCRLTSEAQEITLREVLAGVEKVPRGGYELLIEQRIDSGAWTDTGFGLDRDTMAILYPSVRSVRLRTLVTRDPDLRADRVATPNLD